MFYVALTRARESLILAWNEESKSVKEGVNSLLTENWRAWIDSPNVENKCQSYFPAFSASSSSSVFETELDSGSVESTDIADERSIQNSAQNVKTIPYKDNAVSLMTLERQRLRHSVSEWMNLLTCRLKYLWLTIDRKTVFQDSDKVVSDSFSNESSLIEEKMDPSFTGLDANVTSAEFGSKVHRTLELNLSRDENDLATELSKLNPKSGSIWAKGVKSAINSSAELYSEVPFELKFVDETGRSEILVGSIDLVEEYENSVTVTDFKIVKSNKSDAELLNRYELQLKVYGLAAIKIKLLKSKVSRSNNDLYLNHQVIQCKTRLIVFSDSSVRVVDGPVLSSEQNSIGLLEQEISNIVKRANATIGQWMAAKACGIVSDEKTFADPGVHCRYCQFLRNCSASMKDGWSAAGTNLI